MKPAQLVVWLTIAGMLLGAGIWLGKLQQEVSDMHKVDLYLHGHVNVPEVK